MNPWDQFTGVNAGYVFDLYERFQRDPQSVDEATRAAFARWSPEIEAAPSPEPATVRTTDLTAAIATFNLAESIRRFGHLAARLDPLGFTEPLGDPSLLPQSHGLTTDTLARLPASIVAGPVAAESATALDAIERLRGIYCGTTGHDYNHVFVPEERVWLRQAVETSSVPRRTRSTPASCSIESPRSRCSSVSCTARSRARRGSRSKASIR
jgi:2-oxoglutarate dehydrogenase E1 component